MYCYSDVWIITGGTSVGINRIVGEAMRDHSRMCEISAAKSKVNTIGIATWGAVENRCAFVGEKVRNCLCC